MQQIKVSRNTKKNLTKLKQEIYRFYISSVSHSVVSNSLRPHGLQHTRPPCPSPTPRVYSNSCPLQRRHWHPTPVLLPGKSHGQRSMVGCSPWGCYESDTTERLHFHFSLSCIGEGNGNPLQCSCLENPREGEPGGLPSMGSHRVGHAWSDLAAAAACPLSRWCHPTISSSVVPFSSCLQYFPASGYFPVSQFFASGGQRIGVSASASVLPMNIQDWFPLHWAGWISLPSKGLKSLLQHHSSKASILWCSAFFIVELSYPYRTTGKNIALTRWTFVGKVTYLLFNMLSRLVITFLPRSKGLLISWLQSPSAEILHRGLFKWPNKGFIFTLTDKSLSVSMRFWYQSFHTPLLCK